MDSVNEIKQNKNIGADGKEEIVKISIKSAMIPPEWALKERLLFDQLNKASIEFTSRYTRPDGTLIWRGDWPGMDGSDDPYEGFMNLALLYVLGGDDDLYDLSRKIWDGITWQWSEYGQIDREFDCYYDWMHHGESYLFIYFLGLCAPSTLKDRQRAFRFADMYTGEDQQAQNYDTKLKLIRSPITGSRGPRFVLTAEDWCTHRGILDNYLAPYEDIPDVDFSSGKCAWSNDAIYTNIISLMNERMTRGDVPLNLNSTGLVTHAFLHSGMDKYRQWVLEYLDSWKQRIELNGGIIPDNVGLNGIIGEYNQGKWWGGYYGWRWPHGFVVIIEALTNACVNAVLLTGDTNKLDVVRSQIDLNWSLRKEENGQWLVPYKYFDDGWNDYRKATPKYSIHLWIISMEDQDLERIERIPKDHDWNEIIIPNVSGKDNKTGRGTKHYIGNTEPWFQFIRGLNQNYPQNILDANYLLIKQQLEKMRSSEGDPKNWSNQFNQDDFSSIHIWQEMCPVYMEGLLQLTLGGPMHISHGGLQHASIRYFDVEKKRPGLPQSIAALVKHIDKHSITLQLVNVDLFTSRSLIVQAGVFGEHRFNQVSILNEEGTTIETIKVNHKWLEVELFQGTGTTLLFNIDRYVNIPSYDIPWIHQENNFILKGRDLI